MPSTAPVCTAVNRHVLEHYTAQFPVSMKVLRMAGISNACNRLCSTLLNYITYTHTHTHTHTHIYIHTHTHLTSHHCMYETSALILLVV